MRPLASGKTKDIFAQTVVVRSRDQVTWGNVHQADMPGKAELATTTTVNIFRFLDAFGVETAFNEQVTAREFTAAYCEMIPIEAVGRSVIDPKSSYKRRNPDAPTGVVLDEPITELFLKSDGPFFKGYRLPDADPLVGDVTDDGFWVHHAGGREHEPAWVAKELFGQHGELPLTELFAELGARMQVITIVLRDGFKDLGCELGDLKCEFGYDMYGNLLLADVIDWDSLRLRDKHGIERSKQVIRDGKSVEAAMDDLRFVAKKSKLL